jgi:hypothetical protein
MCQWMRHVVALAVVAAAWPVVAGATEAGPPNPQFTACRSATKLIVDYRFTSFPQGRDRRPWLLVTSAKSAGWKYPPLTFRTSIRKRSGRVVQPLGLGGAPWRVFLSVYAPSGRRSPTIDRLLLRC